MGLTIILLALFVTVIAAILLSTITKSQAPQQTPCTGNCRQGRDCTCEITTTNPDWPFPVGRKP